MTTLEFICAQSPNALKGILIGIWYSNALIEVHGNQCFRHTLCYLKPLHVVSITELN